MPHGVPAWLLAYKLCGQATARAAPPPDKTLLIIGLEGGGLLMVSHGHQHSEEEERANANLKLYVFSAAGEDCRAKNLLEGKI